MFEELDLQTFDNEAAEIAPDEDAINEAVNVEFGHTLEDDEGMRE